MLSCVGDCDCPKMNNKNSLKKTGSARDFTHIWTDLMVTKTFPIKKLLNQKCDSYKQRKNPLKKYYERERP